MKFRVERHEKNCKYGIVSSDTSPAALNIEEMKARIAHLEIENAKLYGLMDISNIDDEHDPCDPKKNRDHPINLANESVWKQLLVALKETLLIKYIPSPWIYTTSFRYCGCCDDPEAHARRDYDKGELSNKRVVEMQRVNYLLNKLTKIIYDDNRRLTQEKIYDKMVSILRSAKVIADIKYPQYSYTLGLLVDIRDYTDYMYMDGPRGPKLKPEHATIGETIEYYFNSEKQTIIRSAITLCLAPPAQ